MRRCRSADSVVSVSAQSAARSGRSSAEAFVEGRIRRTGGFQLLPRLRGDEVVVALAVRCARLPFRLLRGGQSPVSSSIEFATAAASSALTSSARAISSSRDEPASNRTRSAS